MAEEASSAMIGKRSADTEAAGSLTTTVRSPATATPAKRVRLDPEASSDPIGSLGTDSPSVRTEASRGGGRARGGGKPVGKAGDRREKYGRGGSAAGGGNSTRGAKMREWGKKPLAEGETEVASEDKPERLAKKKVAVLIGYNGIGYSGSQINPGVKTIEGEIFDALVKAGAVSADNSDNPQKVGLSRAARTDAGVHAAVNVLSLKMILSPPLLPAGMSIEAFINSFLPSTVRLWSVLRVQGSFSPRTLCDQRQYEYTLPTHTFLGPKPNSAMGAWLARSRAKSVVAAAAVAAVEGKSEPGVKVEEVPVSSDTEVAASEAIAASDAFWSAQPEDSTFADDLVSKRAWRISPGLLQSVRAFVHEYEGSHNYYNFTVGKDFRDRSNQRVMKKLEVSDPFLVNGVEYVSVGFLGQSFMLHQIRKMIGLLILAVRSSTPPSLIPETFGPSRIHVPKAPGLGLLLIEPQYLEYNKRVVEANAKIDLLLEANRLEQKDADDQMRDTVEIGELKEMVDKFKQDEIYKRMWEVEQTDAVFSKWVNFLDVYTGPDFEYLNSKGIIPPASVFKKGENSEKTRGGNNATAVDMALDVSPPSDDDDTPMKGDAKELEG